jgi:hypothetical protein
MRRPAPHETVGLVLLGVALFALALALRQAQPGLVNGLLPAWAWPLGILAVYLAVALLATGACVPRAAVLLGALLGMHLLYALLMGMAFAVESRTPGGLSPAPLVAGLWEYPPAVLLQAAFVIPAGCALFGGARPSGDVEEATGEVTDLAGESSSQDA